MILLTGGAGFIGSHIGVELLAAGGRCVVLDNFSNAQRDVLARMRRIVGRDFPWVEADVRNRAALARVFAQYPIRAVVHLAGLKAVGESVAQPLRYWEHNAQGTLSLLQAMHQAGVHALVFSSSATVYQASSALPLREDAPLAASSPYGWSKLCCEQMLRDLVQSEPGRWHLACLRYFNPVGAHASGWIGEAPQGTPNNLMPFIADVAAGLRPQLNIFGADWPTPDGTGRRDYIHVSDLALGHLAALRHLEHNPGLLTLNLGTGKPVSVREMVTAFERASGRFIPCRVVARRPGDLAEYWADPGLAEQTLAWRAQHGIERMCQDAWRWQQNRQQLVAAT